MSETGNSLRVAVCVPSGDMVHMDFAVSLARMLADMTHRRIPSILVNEKAAILPQGRQKLVNRALANGATHLLFLDSDMTFPPETGARLLSHDRDIVGVAASTRLEGRQRVTAMKRWGEPLKLGPDDGLVAADYLGCGGLLVKAAVFRRMEKPYFPARFVEERDGRDVWLGEDYGFCDKARELGFDVLVDAKLSFAFGHLGQKSFTLGQIGGHPSART